MIYKLHPINISNLVRPIKSISDEIFDGSKSFPSIRNNYKIKDIYCYKNQIISMSYNGSLISIIGVKAERRNFRSFFTVFDKIKLSRAKEINNNKNNFIFIPHARFKNNYWHCLIDNISQLLFVLLNNENLNVLIPKDTGSVIKKYIYFLKNKFKFSIFEFDPTQPIYIKSSVIFTEPPVLGGFEHNKEIRNRLIDEAAKELGVKKINDKDIVYKFGSVPHRFNIKNDFDMSFYKCYTPLIAAPVRASSLLSLRELGSILNKKKDPPNKIIYSQRVDENPKDLVKRNPINEDDLIKTISDKINAEIIDFSKLNFEEQILAMQTANLFICVHGSGPTNVAFMKTNTHFIEIMPYRYSLPKLSMSKILTHALGINYYRIDGIECDQKQRYKIETKEILKIISKITNINV